MERKALGGAVWSLLSFGASRVVILLNTVILARLLEPSEFGLLALALLTLGAVGFIGELGLGSAFVLRQDLDRRAQGTVLSLMLLAGGLTAAAMVALSPLVGAAFGEPRLSPILAVLSVTLLITGFTWFYEQVLVRDLQFRRRFVTTMTRAVITLVVGVGFAAAGAGVWSLVAGELAGTVALGVAQLFLAPYRVRLGWDRKVVREMLAAGRGFMALGGLTFVRQNLDYFAIARVLGSRPLGFYTMAYRFSELPATGIAGPIASVTFPAFARMRARGEDINAPFLRTLRTVALVTAPMGLVLSACAEPLVLFVLGEAWRPTIGALTVLGLSAVLRPVQVTCSSFLGTLGRAGSTAVLTAASVGFLTVATLLAARAGIVAVAWVLTAEGVVALGLHMFTIGRFGVSFRAQLSALWPVAVASPVAWVAGFGARQMSTHLVPPVTLLVSGVTLIVTYAAVVAIVSPRTLREGIELATRLIRRRSRPSDVEGPRDRNTGVR